MTWTDALAGFYVFGAVVGAFAVSFLSDREIRNLKPRTRGGIAIGIVFSSVTAYVLFTQV